MRELQLFQQTVASAARRPRGLQARARNLYHWACGKAYTAGMMPSQKPRGTIFGPALSAMLHCAGLLLLLLAGAKAPQIEDVKLPGTSSGKHLLLTYSLGGQASANPAAMPRKAAPSAAKPIATAKVAPAPAVPAPPQAEQGSGSSGLTALGSGNVKIAALKVFPRPQPDLSSLPHGRGGNVVLDAVIDNHGTITDLKVVSGLNDTVDQQVLAAVRGWSFEPATRDGLPIASEQEIVLHYERG
jgi:protein TonB